MDQAETKKLIDQILGELDEKQRMVVGMFYYEQMSVNEIAEALNCSVNTVKSRLNYARKKIGKEIAELEKKGVILRTAAPIPKTSGSSGTDTEGEVPGESGDRKSDCHRNCSSSDLYGNRDRCCENSGQASAGAGDTGAAGGYR